MVASTLLAACAVPRPKPVPPPPPGDFAVSLDVSSRAQPIYPGYDVIYALGGTTLLDAVISDTGSLVGLRIEQSSGHRELDRAATDAVRNWKFRPGNRGGYRAGGVVRIPLHFNPRPFFASVSSNALWPVAYAHPHYMADKTPIHFATVNDAQEHVSARAHQPITGISEIRQFQIRDARGRLLQWWIFTDLDTPDAMATRLMFEGTPAQPVVAVSSLCTRPGICAARKAQTLQGPAFASTL